MRDTLYRAFVAVAVGGSFWGLHPHASGYWAILMAMALMLCMEMGFSYAFIAVCGVVLTILTRWVVNDQATVDLLNGVGLLLFLIPSLICFWKGLSGRPRVA